MYLLYYQLERKPFQITTDPRFLWLGDKHKEALAVLRYALLDNKGFLLLTGDVGTGKTTLINALVSTLGQEIVAATLLDPGLERKEFFAFLAKTFNIDRGFAGKGEFILHFSKFLNDAYEQRKKILLIIDEAQRLSQELLEEIRLLSNIERQSAKLINIFFVGQIEFNGIILDKRNKALRQRIGVNFDLKPLTDRETGQYIHHRLKVAGARKTIFTSGAVQEAYKFSKGYPRLINIICDRALVTGYTKESKKIGSKIVKECAKELTLQDQKGMFKKNRGQKKPALPPKDAYMEDRPKHGRIEKVLYAILALLVAAWIAIAVYFYFPLNAFERDDRRGSNVAPSANEQKTEVATRKDSTTLTENAGTSSEANQTDQRIDDEASDAPPEVTENERQLQLPDENMVIRIELNNGNEIPNEGIRALDNLVVVMARYRELAISIKGYSVSQGSHRYNKKMSEFTANIVKGYLIGKGVSPQRIETVGMWLINPEAGDSRSLTQGNRQWVEIQFSETPLNQGGGK